MAARSVVACGNRAIEGSSVLAGGECDSVLPGDAVAGVPSTAKNWLRTTSPNCAARFVKSEGFAVGGEFGEFAGSQLELTAGIRVDPPPRDDSCTDGIRPTLVGGASVSGTINPLLGADSVLEFAGAAVIG